MDQKIVLGTRGSELALAQARLVERALQQQWPELNVETKIIATRGDQTKPIDSRAGWKGLFTAEIEKALLAGDIDLAVHSAKDLPSETSSALEIAAVLVRGPFEDVLLSKHAGKFASLPTKAIVATSSIRRKYQLHWKRPDLIVVDLRGNVPTRVKKLTDGDWDAVVLARAGIERLGLTSPTLFSETLPLEIFLPAGGQGIIAIQIRENDEEARTIVVAVNDSDTMACLRAERAFLHLLNVDCNAPVGVLARIDNGLLKMRAQFFGEGSSAPREGEVEGQSDRGELLAAQLLDQLRT
ncbi:MAG: hydroxymethylbilane synthase [Verrucomicrobiota bacterium]